MDIFLQWIQFDCFKSKSDSTLILCTKKRGVTHDYSRGEINLDNLEYDDVKHLGIAAALQEHGKQTMKL